MHTFLQTHTRTPHFKRNPFFFVLSAWLPYAPLRPFAQRCKVDTSCLCMSWWVVSWAHLLLRSGLLLFFYHLLLFYLTLQVPPSFKVDAHHVRGARHWALPIKLNNWKLNQTFATFWNVDVKSWIRWCFTVISEIRGLFSVDKIPISLFAVVTPYELEKHADRHNNHDIL